MKDSKVYDLISHLSRREQSQCLRFIKSPYFNASKQLITLYNLIVKDLNNPPAKRLTKEKAWKKLKPDSPYDDVRYRKFSSDLSKLIESYLVQLNLEESPFDWNLNLVEASEKRKIKKLYNSSLKRVKNASTDKGLEDANFYLEQYQIEKNIFEVQDSDTKRGKRANLEDISTNLDNFYFGQKLKLFCDAKSRQNIKDFHYELDFQKEIIDYIKRSSNLPPAISIYYQIFLVYTHPEEEKNYYKLKELLNLHALKFKKKDARDELYLAAQNYCIQKINKGNPKFLDELFDLYQDMIQKEILFVNNELQPWVFRNICVVAMRLGKYQWVGDFINQYSEKIPENYRKNAVSFNTAQLYFYQKRHDEVIRLLQTVEYDDVTYNLNSKSMLIATYYETDNIEPLYSLFDSFRAYLSRRKEIPIEKRQRYLNLIKITRKLTKLLPSDAAAIEKLKTEVQATKNIVSRNWILEKIAELE